MTNNKKLNYTTANGINFDIHFENKKSVIIAKIEDENIFMLDKSDLREMAETARVKGIDKVELHTNYSLELRSSEKPKFVGLDFIKKMSMSE